MGTEGGRGRWGRREGESEKKGRREVGKEGYR